MRNLIIASTSTLYREAYLEYLLPSLKVLFNNTEEILFIPFARPSGISHDTYTKIVSDAFLKIDKKVIGLHTFDDKNTAIENAKGIFTGGGNTFLLVKALHELAIMESLKLAIDIGVPYLGTSAGSNICGPNMQNTNDMPIVYPPSFKTLNIIPFNINAHYLDPSTSSKHMGETRETRIKEFHTQNTISVLGLREGSWLSVTGKSIVLKGSTSARLFKKNKTAAEINPETDLNTLSLEVL